VDAEQQVKSNDDGPDHDQCTAMVSEGCQGRLTDELRGRPEAPDQSRGRTLSFSARGETTERHGPLQRLLDGNANPGYHPAIAIRARTKLEHTPAAVATTPTVTKATSVRVTSPVGMRRKSLTVPIRTSSVEMRNSSRNVQVEVSA
jgi:hypothetical protein